MKDGKINFEVKGKSFKSGYYTYEVFNGIPTYWLAYSKNSKGVNISRLVLTFFDKLPENGVINAHKS